MSDRAEARPSAAGFLRGVSIVFHRETGAYFDSSIAYVYASVFLLLSSSIFINSFFLDSILEMGQYFRMLPFLLALFIPAITMRSWAEERSHGTFELLMTLPFRPLEVVLGKYLASLVFYLAVLLGSFPIVMMLFFLGKPDLGLLISSYIGAALLGSTFLALGIFISGLTREQIVAFVLTTFACALLVLSGQERVVEVLDGLAPAWQIGTWLYESVSVLPHYNSFLSGVVSLADVVYFGITSLFFLWMNVITLKLVKY
ncbi:MAG TPA: ABC transporter permease subunit [Planctomycetota bacterium]|nr:ABC transporter permease subunit [Planctomycetota bacterium]